MVGALELVQVLAVEAAHRIAREVAFEFEQAQEKVLVDRAAQLLQIVEIALLGGAEAVRFSQRT